MKDQRTSYIFSFVFVPLRLISPMISVALLNPAIALTTSSSQARFLIVPPAIACGGQVATGLARAKKQKRIEDSSLLVACAIASGAYAKALASACDGARRGASISN
jgi:hypothetical protein